MLLFVTALILLSYLSASWVLTHDWYSATEGTPRRSRSSRWRAPISWVTYDLIIRARQNDVVPSDVNRATLRLLLSLPFSVSPFSAFAGVLARLGCFDHGTLAFFVGAFPTDTVLKCRRRTARNTVKLDAHTIEDA